MLFVIHIIVVCKSKAGFEHLIFYILTMKINFVILQHQPVYGISI